MQGIARDRKNWRRRVRTGRLSEAGLHIPAPDAPWLECFIVDISDSGVCRDRGHERRRKCAARLPERITPIGASALRRNSVQTALPQMTEEEPGNEVATLGWGGFELPEFRILAGNRHHWVDDGPLLLISALRNFLIPIVIAAVN
jgi:hypothetical protein